MSATIATDNSKTAYTNDTARQSHPSSWKLEGDYFVGGNCDIVCPCSFFQDRDDGSCYVTCAWHIQNGVYDDNTTLDNQCCCYVQFTWKYGYWTKIESSFVY
jgi:hypothetical protein